MQSSGEQFLATDVNLDLVGNLINPPNPNFVPSAVVIKYVATEPFKKGNNLRSGHARGIGGWPQCMGH